MPSVIAYGGPQHVVQVQIEDVHDVVVRERGHHVHLKHVHAACVALRQVPDIHRYAC